MERRLERNYLESPSGSKKSGFPAVSVLSHHCRKHCSHLSRSSHHADMTEHWPEASPGNTPLPDCRAARPPGTTRGAHGGSDRQLWAYLPPSVNELRPAPMRSNMFGATPVTAALECRHPDYPSMMDTNKMQ